ncbi:unnamed protein product [Cyclocybe aegerita]|uniref:PH domain-containing protein n=1 Tax=Cyclocybe aegerita TaxID=1973307 RepID=A0A8S0VSG9_CYCAE|nr:unnamed protein product [Cyclocybe aegerita]
MSPAAPPPTPQEIQRKLSVHSVSRPKPTNLTVGPVSGTESDSDSVMTPDVATTPMGGHTTAVHVGASSVQPPLSSIAERRSDSGEDSEDDEDVPEGGWKAAEARARPRNSIDEGVIKAGYLWKKGERRKTWKKRWFVLRPAHIAYYKSSAEYRLLHLLELSDVHSCTPVNLKRHDNTFGLISPTRTFYLQASNAQEVQAWVKAIEDARQTLLATSTQTSASAPIPIPPSTNAGSRTVSRGSIPLSSSPPQVSYGHAFTSSDSEDAMPAQQERVYTSPTQAAAALSPSKSAAPQKDPAKVVLSGYLMKCGSKRRNNWRKRWFVLTGEKLVYSGSHMDTKPHRQFPFNDILDTLEFEMPQHAYRPAPTTPSVASPPAVGSQESEIPNSPHTFKIVTTKRTLLLCAPTEEDEIKWMGAIRALIARRAESGQVPGKLSKSPAGASAAGPGNETSPSSTSAPGIAPTTSSGIKSKVRRLSAAGSIGLSAHHPEQEMREAKTT